MTPAVGADIESLCSKCGDVWHVIVAKVGQDIVRVICKECGSQHRYRNPKKPDERAKRASTGAAARPARPMKIVERFEKPSVAADLDKPPRAYAPSERYAVGERVEHPSFGQGVVESLELGKMTTFFAVGRKVLACAKAEAPGTSAALARPKPFAHTRVGAPPDAKRNAHAPAALASSDDDA